MILLLAISHALARTLRYDALSAADLTSFANNLKENRPFLFECPPPYVAQLEAICKGEHVQLKLGHHCPNSILQMPCDSNELLGWLAPP